MRHHGTALAYGLLLTQTCAALPSAQYKEILQGRQASRDNSTTTTSSSSGMATPTPTSSVDDSTLSVSDLLGLPPLTADDELFILEQKIVDLAGLNTSDSSKDSSNERRADIQNSYNNPTKWGSMSMDLWLEGWANYTTVDGVLLKDSSKFLEDFWTSTRDESVFTCNNILASCIATPPNNNTGQREDIKWEDRLRAFYARQAIQVWHAELYQAWRITTDVALGSQTMAREIRDTFVADLAAKPGNVLDVILPMIAIVGLLVPAVAPVAALISGVVAITVAVSGRDLDEQTLALADESAPYMSLEARAKSGPIPAESVRSLADIPDPKAGDGVKSLEDRVKTVEDEIAKSKEKSLEKQLAPLKTAGDFLDKAAKVVTAVKALSPGLPKSSLNQWANFDSSILAIFNGYKDSVEQSYLVNINTWSVAERKGDNGIAVGASGIKSILAGGRWFKSDTSFKDIGKTTKLLSSYYRKVILMEILKAQSIHLWKQHFDSREACVTALSVYKEENLISEINPDDQCAQRGTGIGSWELRIARKPLTQLSGDNGLRLIRDGVVDGKTYYQRTNYQQNTAGYPKWTSSNLNAAHIDLTTNQIFDLADECSKDSNFFTNSNPTAADRYKGMVLASNTATGGLNVENPVGVPKCLFSLPVLDINRDNLDWCPNNMYQVSTQGAAVAYSLATYTTYPKVYNRCASHDDFQYMADWYMCLENVGPYDSSRVAQPGCSGHEAFGYTITGPK